MRVIRFYSILPCFFPGLLSQLHFLSAPSLFFKGHRNEDKRIKRRRIMKLSVIGEGYSEIESCRGRRGMKKRTVVEGAERN
jgi:hypothetical protein